MTATSYVSVAEFKDYASIPASNDVDDTLIATVVQATYGAVNQHCGRVFATSTGARLFEICNTYRVQIDDVSSASGFTISVDVDGDGTYETDWAAGTYELRPLNGLLDGAVWPYTEIRALTGQSFPPANQIAPAALQVSATWGWPAVPSEVVQATNLLAMDLYKSKDAPFGVAGTNEFGTLRVSSNVAGMARLLLGPYRRHGVML